MSIILLEFARSFAKERLTADQFSEAYQEFWKIERDNLPNDHSGISECLSSIFCLADLYNPSENKEEYELNAKQLREKIKEAIQKLED